VVLTDTNILDSLKVAFGVVNGVVIPETASEP
jgi:hypothetical protein